MDFPISLINGCKCIYIPVNNFVSTLRGFSLLTYVAFVRIGSNLQHTLTISAEMLLTYIFKMCMKMFNGEKIIFEIFIAFLT